MTRFHFYLCHRPGQECFRASKLSADHLGLLIQDNNETVAKTLTALMRRFHKQGTLWSKVERIIETPLFVDSTLTSMVQMADLCAYATRRFFENQETDLFDRIWCRFDRSQGGKVVGIRHFWRAHPANAKSVSLTVARLLPPQLSRQTKFQKLRHASPASPNFATTASPSQGQQRASHSRIISGS